VLINACEIIITDKTLKVKEGQIADKSLENHTASRLHCIGIGDAD
jgi:hypothetical protein